MNDVTFDDRIKGAMAPAPLPENLAGQVDSQIERFRARRLSGRRWKLAGSGAVVGALAVMLFPVAQAQVVLARMAGALEDVDAVRMERYNVLEGGARAWAGTIDYERGKWKTTNPGETYFYIDGKSYRYDALTESYVVEERPQGPFAHNSTSLSVSSMLDRARGWGQSVRIKEANGSIVATIDGPDLNERTVVTADSKTMLPVRIESYALESGQWKLHSVMKPDYAPKFEAGHFAMRADLPRVSKQDYEKRMVEALTSDSLLSIDSLDRVFHLRSVEVASDGTVFVAYQIGDKTRSWRGFRLRVTDDIGNEYANPPMLDGGYDLFLKHSQGGRLELEVFVPLEPTKGWRPHTVRLQAAFSQNKEIVEWNMSQIFSQRADGTAWFTIYPNTPGVDRDNPPPWRQVWERHFDAPTCGLNPEYIANLDYQSFGNDVYSKIFRSSVLARHFQNAQDWANAERWLLEDLRLKRESASRGFGTWALDQALNELGSVRKHLGR
jgi:hypothetical protein